MTPGIIEAHAHFLSPDKLQLSHGETAEETGAMLGMNAHALGVRNYHVPLTPERVKLNWDAHVAARDE